ncbi:hypothetical protein JJO78_16285 [Marinobacter sp. DS40M6]|nr:hypothetical protein [Marinobacter sp. DS40M6]
MWSDGGEARATIEDRLGQHHEMRVGRGKHDALDGIFGCKFFATRQAPMRCAELFSPLGNERLDSLLLSFPLGHWLCAHPDAANALEPRCAVPPGQLYHSRQFIAGSQKLSFTGQKIPDPADCFGGNVNLNRLDSSGCLDHLTHAAKPTTTKAVRPRTHPALRRVLIVCFPHQFLPLITTLHVLVY